MDNQRPRCRLRGDICGKVAAAQIQHLLFLRRDCHRRRTENRHLRSITKFESHGRFYRKRFQRAATHHIADFEIADYVSTGTRPLQRTAHLRDLRGLGRVPHPPKRTASQQYHRGGDRRDPPPVIEPNPRTARRDESQFRFPTPRLLGALQFRHHHRLLRDFAQKRPRLRVRAQHFRDARLLVGIQPPVEMPQQQFVIRGRVAHASVEFCAAIRPSMQTRNASCNRDSRL